MPNSRDEKKPPLAKVSVRLFLLNSNNHLFLIKKVDNDEKTFYCPTAYLGASESPAKAAEAVAKKAFGKKVKAIDRLNFQENIYQSLDDEPGYEVGVYLNYRVTMHDEINEKTGEWRSLTDWKNETDLDRSIKDALDEIQADSLEERYKRAIADYQNLLKQSAKEKQEFARYANESLLYKLIPVYDNLKTSLKHVDDSLKDSAWATGVTYIAKQFQDVLNEVGVEEIEVVDKTFDHDTMEAVSGQGDKVEAELRPGYKLNGKVIIHAKVKLED